MNNSLDDVSAKSTQKMAEKEVVEWYNSLPDESRMKLQREFDLLYDNSGCRETKFFKWVDSTRSADFGTSSYGVQRLK